MWKKIDWIAAESTDIFLGREEFGKLAGMKDVISFYSGDAMYRCPSLLVVQVPDGLPLLKMECGNVMTNLCGTEPPGMHSIV